MFRVVKKGSGCRNSWVEMGCDIVIADVLTDS
jgi:hypothetical protein